MDDNAKELTKRSGERFGKRQQLDNFRQEIALHFAPDLAEWNGDEIVLGENYADHLIDGTPLLLARDFKNQIGAMLRPQGKYWFHHRIAGDEEANANTELRQYLDWRTAQMHRAMTDRVTGFTRAADSTDRFFGLFGDACMSTELSKDNTSLRFHNHHTKNTVWVLGEDGNADTITRRERWTARIIIAKFGEKNVHRKIKEALKKSPDQTFLIEHHVLPAEDYEAYSKKFKTRDGFASVWVDAEHNEVLSENPQRTKRYIIPIWQLVEGWQYGISPATMIALPDARLIQQQALVLLEAAEKSANPPLVAYEEAIRGVPELSAGGLTWVDRTYDDRTGQPVYPLDMGKNFPMSIDALMRTEQQLAKAFYLDVLRLPDTGSSRSVEEIQFRIDEYVRSAVPLFAPMHDAYNNAMLHEVDEMCDLAGLYSSEDRPEGLDPEMMTFAWDNPLSEMMERQKANRVGEVGQLAAAIAGMKEASANVQELGRIDFEKMLEDSLIGLGANDWIKTKKQYKKDAEAAAAAKQEEAMAQQAATLAPTITATAGAAKTAAEIDQMGGPGFAMPFTQ